MATKKFTAYLKAGEARRIFLLSLVESLTRKKNMKNEKEFIISLEVSAANQTQSSQPDCMQVAIGNNNKVRGCKYFKPELGIQSRNEKMRKAIFSVG